MGVNNPRSLEERAKTLANKLRVMYCKHWNGHYCEICASDLIASFAAQVRQAEREACATGLKHRPGCRSLDKEDEWCDCGVEHFAAAIRAREP